MKINYYLRAVEAYKRVCDEHMTVYDLKGNAYSSLVYQQPSISLSKVGWKYVHLRNINGPLACYTIQTGAITV